jgi:hypothetical protein
MEGVIAVCQEALEELWGDGLLTVGRGVDVVEGPQEGSDRGEKLGAVRNVEGARFETVPKRRSQVACGSPDSAPDHRSQTLSSKLPSAVPIGDPIKG